MAARAALVAQVVLALALGTAAGWLANRAGMPLPWMLGPMIANTLAAVLRLPVVAPLGLRPVMIPVIGVLIGSALSPALLAQAGQWLLALAVMPIYLALAGTASIYLYRRIGGYDPITAYFAAMPGGLNDMVILGGEAGGDERKIALAHSARILVVVLFVGLFYGFVLDIRAGSARGFVPFSAFGVADAAWLLAAGLVGIPLARLLRLPAGNMLGPMLLSGAAHLAGLVTLPPPTVLVIGAQIVLGTIIGCRFAGVGMRDIVRNLALGALSSLLMILLAVGAALLVAQAGGLDLASVFLAYSPGGLTEMSLLALAMGQEPAFVSLAHLARILMVIFGAPLIFARLGRRY